MARIPKPPKPKKGKQPRCWVCQKVATIRWSIPGKEVEHFAVARFFPEYGEMRMVVVCSSECAHQVQGDNTSASRDLTRKVMRESPVAMTMAMLGLMKEER